jgi:hypothetical protein
LVAGLAVALLIAGFASAEPVPLILDMRDDLGLSARQQGEIKAAYLRQYRNRRLYSARLTIVDIELEDLMEQEGDLDQIKKKLLERAALQTNLKVTEIEMDRKVNSLLSPEQLKKWQTMK